MTDLEPASPEKERMLSSEFEHLIASMDQAGYDWDAEDRKFLPRQDGPMAGGLPLSIQAAREKINPGLIDRSDEMRG